MFYSAPGGCSAENDALFTWKLNNLSQNFNSLAKSCFTTSVMMYTMYTGQVFEVIVSMLTRASENAETCFVALFTIRPPRWRYDTAMDQCPHSPCF